jgi:hypothetical protein
MIHARSPRVFVGVFFAKQGRSMLRPYKRQISCRREPGVGLC